MSRRRLSITLVLVTLVVALGAWLRIRGLGFGLPAVYNPDEVSIMSRALSFATGDLNPHNFLYPTLYFYLLFVWVGAHFAGAYLLGAVPSLTAFQQSFFLDPSAIYLAGRAFTVVCGVAAVLGTWRLATRAWNETAGIAAALFIAVAPFAVRDAHYVKHDVPVTAVIVAAVLVMLALSETHDQAVRSRRLWAASILAGLAASVHYYAVFVGVPLGIAVWLAWSDAAVKMRLAGLAQATAIAAASFVAGSPFLLVEPLTALRDIRANRAIVMDRAVEGGGHMFPSAAAYAEMLARDAIGWPVAVLAIVGIVFLARSRPRALLLLSAFPVVFLLFISNTVAATRYLNPVLPFVAVLAGIGLVGAGGLIRNARIRVLGVAAAALVVASPGIAASWHTGTFFRQPDTRTLALDFVKEHVPDGATVLVQPYSVPLPQSRAGLVEALTTHLGDPRRASRKFQFQLALPVWPAPSYRVLFLGRGGLDVDKVYVDYAELGGTAGLSQLRRLHVQYVILKRYNDESRVMAPLVDALGREARRLHQVTPYRSSTDNAEVEPFLHNTDARLDAALARPGPVIEIWQLP
jgi:hypothetical protein